MYTFFFFFSSRRRHTRFDCDWSSDVCSSDLHFGRFGGRRAASSRALRLGDEAPDLVGILLARPRLHAGVHVHRKRDRKSVVEGKRVDLGGRRIIKKKKKRNMKRNTQDETDHT